MSWHSVIFWTGSIDCRQRARPWSPAITSSSKCSFTKDITGTDSSLTSKSFFARRNSTCEVRHVDLFNPECAPEAAYQGLLTELLDFRPSVQRYYDSIIEGGHRGESIYLGNSGLFRRFTDQE